MKSNTILLADYGQRVQRV